MSEFEAEPLKLPGSVHDLRCREEATRRCTGYVKPSAGMMAPARHGPGPAIYDGGSGFGSQVDSTKASSSRARFGTQLRGKDVSTNLRDGPGPAGYVLPSTLGENHLSTFNSAPSYTQAGRESFGSTHDPRKSAKFPGPGDHNVRHTLVKPSAPSHPMAPVFADPARRERRPGPGTYTSSSGFGRQGISNKPSASSWRIGTSTRPPLLHKGADNSNGPGQYARATYSTVGGQFLSGKPSAPSIGIGTSKRPAPHGNVRHAPGPGRYEAPGGLGLQTSSLKRSQGAVTIKSRTKFGSPYG